MSNDNEYHSNRTYQAWSRRPLSRDEEECRAAATRAAESYGWVNHNHREMGHDLWGRDSFIEPSVIRAGVELLPGNFRHMFNPHYPHFRGEHHPSLPGWRGERSERYSTVNEQTPAVRCATDPQPRATRTASLRRCKSTCEEIYWQSSRNEAIGLRQHTQSEYQVNYRSQASTVAAPLPIQSPSSKPDTPRSRRRRDSNGVSECNSEDDGWRNYDVSPPSSPCTSRRRSLRARDDNYGYGNGF